MTAATGFAGWIDRNILELGREMRWSYAPPLMVYLAAGIQGLTAVVAQFYVKEELGLTAAFLAGLGFWATVPWFLKMPLGHLVDIIWRWKAALVFLGAGLIAASLMIMYFLIGYPGPMRAILPAETWFIISVVLAPVGYVVQDVVADAMTVEAVPSVDDAGQPLAPATLRLMHTTMQTLGRVAIVGGFVVVSLVNIRMFSGIGQMTKAQKDTIYTDLHLIALAIPVISVLGVVLGALSMRRRAARLRAGGMSAGAVHATVYAQEEKTEPSWLILGGGLGFAVFTVAVGIAKVPLGKEIIFVGSMAIVIFLMGRLMKALPRQQMLMLIGTAVIIFIFRATPHAGPGVGWFEIDQLGFDQQFMPIRFLFVGIFALAGMFIFRRFMADRSIAYLIVFLTVVVTVMALPNLGLYYGIHEWTAAHTGGVVDARFIALADAAVESPFSQIAMIPMLAWIANNAPANLKATFFAIMASFTNLALSASDLGAKYLNEIFTITRLTKDKAGTVKTPADYGEMGLLLIAVLVIGFVVPVLAVVLIQRSRWRTTQ